MIPAIKDFCQSYKIIKKSKKLTNFGEAHNSLEQALTKYLEVEHLSLFNNGTTALIAGLKALSLTGEVITTAFTFPATTEAILWNNLTPVLCDINSDDYNIDVSKIEELITPNTSAILAVHTFGSPCDCKRIEQIAKKHKIKVIYDAAHAFGVKQKNQSVASFGDISIFSFHATKIFNTVEGGCICCDNKDINKNINLIRCFGMNESDVECLGLNGKLNEIQSAIGLLNLIKIEKEINKRKVLYEIYCKMLGNIEGITILTHKEDVKPNYQYMIININQNISRDYVYERLKEYNIFAKKYFYPSVNNYKFIQCKNEIKNAQNAAKETLALPLYGSLSENSAEKICSIIKHIIKSKKENNR